MNLCPGLASSLCLYALRRFCHCFQIGSSAYEEVWGAAVHLLGPMHLWPPAVLKDAVGIVNELIGNLFRRFIVRLQAWPWKLHAVLDESLSMQARRAVASEFLQAPPCCVDDSFSSTLRSDLHSVEDLFRPTFQRLQHTVSPTFSENHLLVKNGAWLPRLSRETKQCLELADFPRVKQLCLELAATSPPTQVLTLLRLPGRLQPQSLVSSATIFRICVAHRDS